MSRYTHMMVALLAGVALIWLVPVLAALVTGVPGLASTISWLQRHELPLELLTWGVFALLPVVVAALLVGLVLFCVPGNRLVALVLASAPFVLYSLATNLGLHFWTGSSLLEAASNALPWLIAFMVPLGLLLSMLSLRRPGAA
jgi:hypothetical protein